MSFENYTIKSQQLIQQAIQVAKTNGQLIIDTAHILKAFLIIDDYILSFISKELNINTQQLNNTVDAIVQSKPKGSGAEPNLSNKGNAALLQAEKYLKEFGDEYVTIEHILLSLIESTDEVGDILKRLGFKKASAIEAIKKLRQGETVKDKNAESTYQSLEKYSQNLNKN